MKRFFIHVHVYYYDIWKELKKIIKNFDKFSVELVITVSESICNKQEDILGEFPNARVIIVPNKGYDVAPFLMVLKEINLADYEYVVKLHTKRDVSVGSYLGQNYVADRRWRDFLLKPFLSEKNIDTCINLFETNPIVGIVSHYNCCFPFVKDKLNYLFLNKLKGELEELPKDYKYIAGSMFMARSEVLNDFQNLPYSINDFEEPKQNCFQLAHYLERLLGYFVYKNNYIVEGYDCSNKIKKFLFVLSNIRKKHFKIKIGSSGKKYLVINFPIKIPLPKI